MPEHGQAVVVGVVVVPLVAVRVDEEDVVREGVVVIDDIAGRMRLVVVDLTDLELFFDRCVQATD